MIIEKIIPRSVKTIAIIILVVILVVAIDQYRNKDLFGLVKPRPVAI